eukprot:268466_1
MSKDQIHKLFELISMADGSSSPTHYIDKEDLSDFLLQNYDNNPKLQQYKEQLLTAISPKFKDTKPTTIDILPSLTTSKSEESAMEEQLRRMVQDEWCIRDADARFQEELLKRKTSANATNSPFCDEQNAKQWDTYEVAYWVGIILGRQYCMKRFFDHEINGTRLLYDVVKMDVNRLQKELSFKSNHLYGSDSFQRRLERLRRTALKDEYEAERLKKDEKRKRLLREKQRTLSLDFNATPAVHIVSDTRCKEEEKRNRIQRIQLEATKNESVLNTEIATLTQDKLKLMQQLHDMKERQERLKMTQIEQDKIRDKEKQTLKQQMELLQKNNRILKERNAVLQEKNQELQMENDAKPTELPDNWYKNEIDSLKSKLRTQEMQNFLLQRRLNDEQKQQDAEEE